MRVVWSHNFDPEAPNSGVFMHTLRRGMLELGVQPDLVYLGNLRSPIGIPRAARTLRRAARGADIIHAQFGSACSLATSLVPGRKVVSLRGSDWYRLRGEGPYIYRTHGLLANWMSRLSLRKFSRVIVMSERMRAQVCLHTHNDRIRVLPDGIDLNAFVPMDRQEARARLGFPQDFAPLVLFPTLDARNPYKRPELVKQAVAIARREIPDIQLRFGTGVPHSQMPLLMNAASVVLMASTHEGWPNSIKEALACNTPFVSTNVSDLESIARVESSCSVEPADPVALAAAVIRAIRAPRSETLRSRIEWMENRRIARGLLESYESALQENPPP